MECDVRKYKADEEKDVSASEYEEEVRERQRE